MDASIFLAKLLGIYILVVGAGLILNKATFQKMFDEYLSSPALIYMGGILALFFGLLIVLFHNKWEASWTLIITLFGWLGILKGIWLIVFPSTIGAVTNFYKKSANALTIHGAIAVLLGLFLIWKGFCCG